MNKRPVETIMGIVVIAVAAFFAYFAYNVSDLQVVKGYNVTAIVSDGLVGDKFIKIEPGHGKEMLKDGDVIQNTKDFKTLEDMVGEIIFMVTDNGSGENQ